MQVPARNKIRGREDKHWKESNEMIDGNQYFQSFFGATRGPKWDQTKYYMDWVISYWIAFLEIIIFSHSWGTSLPESGQCGQESPKKLTVHAKFGVNWLIPFADDGRELSFWFNFCPPKDWNWDSMAKIV